MSRTIHKTDKPVTLEGFQAILSPSKFGYSLAAIVDESMVNKLEDERTEVLKWAESKLKNPKRSTLKPEPWEEIDSKPGFYQVRFSWKDGDKYVPVVVDTEGTAITDESTPIYSGTMVKLAFFQKPYVLPTGDIGTSLKAKAIQLISLNSGAGVVDDGDMTAEAAVDLFGTSKGFKVSEPNISADTTEEDEDF